MTEKEAKTKWCPMVRVGEDDAAGNRVAAQGVVSAGPGVGILWQNCIASDCMMWRARWARIDKAEEMKEGHCGLAGTP